MARQEGGGLFGSPSGAPASGREPVDSQEAVLADLLSVLRVIDDVLSFERVLLEVEELLRPCLPPVDILVPLGTDADALRAPVVGRVLAEDDPLVPGPVFQKGSQAAGGHGWGNLSPGIVEDRRGNVKDLHQVLHLVTVPGAAGRHNDEGDPDDRLVEVAFAQPAIVLGAAPLMPTLPTLT